MPPLQQIAFDTIPASLRKPLAYAEFNTRLANLGLSANRQPTVIIAPKLASGSQPVATPIEIFSDADAGAYAGVGSIAQDMAAALFAANPYMSATLVLVNDPAGAAATASVAYSGTVTSSGSEVVWVNDVRIEVAVSATDTPTTVAAAMAAAINALPKLPVTASASAGTLTLTCRHKGTIGNNMMVNAAQGGQVSTGLARAVTAFANGTLVHDVSAALSSIFAAGHKLMVSAWNDAATLAVMRTHLNTVSNSMEMRGCRCWFATVGSVGAATTLSAGLNSWVMHHALLRTLNSKGARTAPWDIAAAMAALDCFEEDPARPLNTLVLTGVAVPDAADMLTRTEQEALLYGGVTPLEIGPGAQVQVVRAITTYTTSAAGAPDAALLDITTPKTLFYFREQVVNDQKIRFARSKFTKRVANAVLQRALEIARLLEDLEILQNLDVYKAQFLWEPDTQNVNRLKLRIPSPVVPGLHLIASRFDLYLSAPINN